MNKKGSAADIIIWVVSAFLVVIFLGLWLFVQTEITIAFSQIVLPTGASINVTEASEATIGQLQSAAETGLPIIAFSIIFAMIISMFLTNFFTNSQPAFAIVTFFIIVIAVILSAYISNQYETLLDNAFFGATLQTFTAANFIMLSLPIWTAVVGFIAAILLYSGIPKDRGFGGGIT